MIPLLAAAGALGAIDSIAGGAASALQRVASGANAASRKSGGGADFAALMAGHGFTAPSPVSRAPAAPSHTAAIVRMA